MRKFNINEIIVFDDITKADLTVEKDLDGYYPEPRTASRKFVQPEETVRAIVEQLKECSTIHSNDYYKSIKFLRKYTLTLEDCLSIIKSVKVSDYYCSTVIVNPEHRGNELIIFEPTVTVEGKDVSTTLYIKLDVEETTNEAIALVSIHEGKRNSIPYCETADNTK